MNSRKLNSTLASGKSLATNWGMQLTDEQKQKVAAWIAEGLKLSDVQSRIQSEFGLSLTYMDTRLIVDDLKLTPLDPVKEPEPVAAPSPAVAGPDPLAAPEAVSPLAAGGSADAGGNVNAGGSVSLSVDQIARVGTIVSGKVTFSDGKIAQWYLDQTGRLGVVPEEEGYRPAPADVQKFQVALDRELAKLGY